DATITSTAHSTIAKPTSSSSLADNYRALRESSSLSTSHASPLRTSDHLAGRVRHVPSPLQRSGPSPFSVNGRPHHTHHEEPCSPREKLEARLASEEATHSTNGSSTPTQAFIEKGLPQSSKPGTHVRLRNVSASVAFPVGITPPSSPITMQSQSRPQHTETRPTPPRNDSIDSAVSSISSNTSQQFNRPIPSHSYQFSHESVSPNPPDMATLLISTGSAEAAVKNLWKEKQSASVHNAQLWRLVEKQRAMILGLNKDLERALKDKERYRKKLKEQLSQMPPLPGTVQKTEQASQRDLSQFPADGIEVHDGFSSSTSALEDGRASSALEFRKGSEAVPTQLQQGSPLEQSPIQPSSSVSEAGSTKRALSADTSALDFRALRAATHVPSSLQNATSPNTRSDLDVSSYAQVKLGAPAVSITQATPIIGANGFEYFVPPLRKAPPAPLDLSSSKRVSASLHQANQSEESDTDYDDILGVTEIPQPDRGRRKTREDDDRVREALASQEDEARSRSKRKSKSKSKNTPQSAAPEPKSGQGVTHTSPILYLPKSPRQLPSAPASLNAILSPVGSEKSAKRGNVISPPILSPGLPVSPRPSDRPIGSPAPRLPHQAMVSPPMSPRANGLPLSPRAPRQPLPLPPNTPLSFASPHLARAVNYGKAQIQPTINTDLHLKPPDLTAEEKSSHGLSEPSSPQIIDRSLMCDQYPGILLPPNCLPLIQVKVSSSRLRPSRHSMLATKSLDEDVFTLALYARSDNRQLWRNEKTIGALPNLHQQLQMLCPEYTASLPDRSLFNGHAPAKIDARRTALTKYFDELLDTPIDEIAAMVVCEFFSSDVIGCEVDETLSPIEAPSSAGGISSKGKSRMYGYLTKRGKNFGGWKARYFVLEGPELRYYESDGGAHLGTIRLQSAQIGKQSQQQQTSSQDDSDNQFRHAFLIREPKRKDSTSLVRHVLCAESDGERDQWVDALLQYVECTDDGVISPSDKKAIHSNKNELRSQRKENSPTDKFDRDDNLQAMKYEEAVQRDAPQKGPTLRQHHVMPSPTHRSFDSGRQNHPAISGPTNGTVIHDTGIWGNKSLEPTSVKIKKRSIFGFGGKITPDIVGDHIPSEPLMAPPPNRVIFGLPLAEAVKHSAPIGIDTQLPAVVYRCLEYLQAKGAEHEEGIFRLSGSNITIKALRERFNNEGDVRLLDGQLHDMHAVASLLKLYLRELPASILTRDLHLAFLRVLEPSTAREDRVWVLNELVHKLPSVNRELLQALSSFLIDIVTNSDVNKMTIRNVGIVFAPTLNIPAPLISLLLTEYSDIFGHVPQPDEMARQPREITVTAPPEDSDAIRSPRHQMFSNLPTPA
ncbi:RhoGAP-domain-containing protein, partial [Pseudovirgaria hyperparasitica]